MTAAANVRMNIPPVKTPRIAPILPCSEFDRKTLREQSKEQYAIDKKKYCYDSLNPGQREIYDYVHNNPNDIIVIQSGPGTGKTFTLKTIAHSWKNPVNVIIYKHDLLYDFRLVAVRHTVAKFIMEMFNLSFEDYKRLEYSLGHDLNGPKFLLAIVNLMSKVNMPCFKGSLVILDEYTVVPKPLLLILLILLKYYKIGTILCGNKYQLENIPNSEHMGNCSSLDIANYFANTIFHLERIERCTNIQYNKIIEYISTLASSKWVDDFARSLIAVLFHKQILSGSTTFAHTHLAGSHEKLTEMANQLVVKEKHRVSYYSIDNSEVTLQHKPKFLQYLPLVIGSKYYVDEISEENLAELVSIENTVVGLRFENGDKVTRVRINQDDWFSSVIFEEHREFLKNGNIDDKICNFPIYPANFLTIHKSQGRMISGLLDINLDCTTYQGLYVALSRVQDPSQIVNVSISDPLPYLVSCIVNFEELVDPEFVITAELLQTRMINYKCYYPFSDMLDELDTLVRSFFQTSNKKNRVYCRNLVLEKVKNLCAWRRNPPLSMDEQEDWKNTTVYNILEHYDLFLGLTCLSVVDRGVWLKEFITHTPGIKLCRETKRNPSDILSNMLYSWGGVCYMPGMEENMMTYIEQLSNPSVFCKQVYKKYVDGLESEITTAWLVDILNKAIMERGEKADGKGRKRSFQEAMGEESSSE